MFVIRDEDSIWIKYSLLIPHPLHSFQKSEGEGRVMGLSRCVAASRSTAAFFAALRSGHGTDHERRASRKLRSGQVRCLEFELELDVWRQRISLRQKQVAVLVARSQLLVDRDLVRFGRFSIRDARWSTVLRHTDDL